ncbi:Long-chain-fatty-acid--CoA ligase [Thalassovita gelatinovora]|uniref:Long-chain-fatty-acid--CoA ligase n=1 Tax=Thalassovita gelatinovora TaxID=53501 RepID=A0A0P1FDN3_THAGE|nr:feruloyl-CoA synthase [Thalassovita gelatinovora]QIZ81491.1 feruloyl-CoA synthase [Thalassovita gelatinovora]CUH66339.1 Long-chain-fatty-acid--CoA ligase [Thalassovita gelatinovora]SEQ24104.1 feruloyl-CoA synthase [Thalassovita gelatinovora]
MTDHSITVPQEVITETRADGTLILRSSHPMGPVADTTGDWLHQWAVKTPDAVFIAERQGAGWREVRYAQALDMVRRIGAWLLDQGYDRKGPIVVMSGNSVDHGLLALAAQYVGIAVVPVAEQYSLIPGAHERLLYVIEKVRPGLLFVDNAGRYGAVLKMDELAGYDVLATQTEGAPRDVIAMDAALQGGVADVDAAHAKVGLDTVGKILFTSGSTSNPKGVITTHRMMCVNQTQIADAFPVLRAKAPKILDWLPWNHVFGGSHNFNMMLANGGALYIDDGKPTEALFPRSLENMKMHSGTLAFNVPVGFARQVEALKADPELRKAFFTGLDFTFYAGASLPQETWQALGDMASEVTGTVPLMVSSWGMTETAPATLIVHERVDRSGIIGVPVPGAEIKLVPDEDGRYELRCKGPNIMPGYFEDPEKTAESFDPDGFLITGDAVKFVDPGNADRGLSFDGRISEDFKLTSGTWVRAASLRNGVLTALDGLIGDLVITGQDRAELGVLLFPVQPAGGREGDIVTDAALVAEVRHRLAKLAGSATGSSTRIGKALICAEAPSLTDHEITAKGNLNIRKVLTRRAALVEKLYDDEDADVIRV